MNKLFLTLITCVTCFLIHADVQITKQPEPKEVNLGDAVTFSVEAFAPPGEAILYQWYYNGQAISGATSASFTLESVQKKNLGQYWVKVGNLSSMSESTHVALTALAGVTSQIFAAVELEFPTQFGGIYIIERSLDLKSWSAIADPITAEGTAIGLFLPTRPNARTFYRVIQRLVRPDVLESLNGFKISFNVVSPPGQARYEIAFTGAAGAKNGNYTATGAVNDIGTYNYSINGTQGTLVVLSSSPFAIPATYSLDFSNSTYVKTQNNRVLDSGFFEY
ncbi:MAG: immunoglobulin domain-containing protein [Verrucomicrobiota bacterium]